MANNAQGARETMTPTFDAAFRDRFEALLRWRRDVRRFRADPLPDGLVERLLGLACLAPSVGNSQPWRFVIVENGARRADVIASFERSNNEALAAYRADPENADRAENYAGLKLAGLVEAPVHLAVFADEETALGHGLGRRTMPETLCYSVVGAIQTLWLAARAHGVGLGWVSIIEPDEVTARLDVPESWRLIGYFCLGYPVEEHLDPELERHGWQQRWPSGRFIFRR